MSEVAIQNERMCSYNPKLPAVSFKDFMTKLLNGVAIGIVIGLIPNAILGEVFKALASTSPIFVHLLNVVSGAQFSVPLLVGCLVAYQFKMNPIEMASVGATTFISSGVVTMVDGAWKIAGIGDLINTMIVAALAVLFVRLLFGRLGSLTMILLPVLTVTIIGGIGFAILPYIRNITAWIGAGIESFTRLQPLLMSILLSVSFAIIFISPISTVAIGLAVGLSGLASGAANMGIASCAMVLVVGSLHVNKLGVTLAVFLGSMKLFIPNWLKNPIINLPIILNGIVGGILAYLFNIQGTPQSSGFGFSGLVGPINAYKYMTQAPAVRVLLLFLCYFVLTALASYIIDFVCTRVLKVYKHDIYYFEQ